MLNQEALDKPIKHYIAPLAEHLEDLTRLIRGCHGPISEKFSPTMSTSASFGNSVRRPTQRSLEENAVWIWDVLKLFFRNHNTVQLRYVNNQNSNL